MTLRLRAPGKVNLGLEILGRRSDGFHEIRSVAHTIALFDIVEVEPAPHIVLHAPGELGPASDNLATLAVELMRERFAVAAGASIRLRKGIPVSAGLGGGSSDAAATIRLLRRLWSIREPLPRFLATAAQVGSDVPFFLTGGAAFLTGRGERLRRPYRPDASCWSCRHGQKRRKLRGSTLVCTPRSTPTGAKS